MTALHGDELPLLQTPVPGPQSRAWVDRLAQRECPAITSRRARRANALGVADTDPVVWKQARGAVVEDMDGNRFVDLTAGFGVAGIGHRNPVVVKALQDQSEVLLHAMGDAFPDPKRIELLEQLGGLTGLDHGILGSSGSDAVEAALKTAKMASGRDGVLCFSGGYHGLSYGALSVIGYKRSAFQAPFSGQLGDHVVQAEFGGELPDLSKIGAVIVEPIQGRGGIRVPPAGWHQMLRRACNDAGSILIFDEIYSAFGRTGRRFASEHFGVQPDLLCIGKSLAGGFPISACMGTQKVMESWGASKGEALHTQTFLGNPLGCAMALAALGEMARLDLPKRARAIETKLRARLPNIQIQGKGGMLGLRVPNTLSLSRGLLEKGFLVLPAGESAEVLALTPPLTITPAQLDAFVMALESLL